MSLVGHSIIARSFSVGSTAMVRLTQGSTLRVDVTFREALSEAFLFVETRVGERVDRTRIGMRADGNRFHAEVPCSQPGVVRFKVRYKADGQWHQDHVPYCYIMVDPKRLQGLRMYTLIPLASGSMRKWKELLPAIASMGFNTVHLLPITRMGKSESPYAAYDLFAVDPRYLDPEDPRDGHAQLVDFVEALKRNKLALCVDLVLNHIGTDSVFAEHQPDFLAEDPHELDGIRRAGWQAADTFHRWEDLALLDFEPFDSRRGTKLWSAMLRYARYWARFAAETGGVLRLDNLHSSHRPFITWAMRRIRTQYPELVVLAELFTDEATTMRLTREVGLHLILATQWEHKFVPELRSYIGYLHHSSRRLRYFFPISSHDSGVPAQEYGDVRSTGPRLVVSALLGPGATGIVQGVEHGVLEKIRFIGGPSKVELSPGVDFSRLIARLFELVDAYPALQTPGNLAFFDADHHAILAAARRDPVTDRAEVLICVNLDIHSQQTLHCDLTSVAPEGATFRDVETGETLTSGRLTMTLEPGAHRVFVHL